jgi:hypothetical protein
MGKVKGKKCICKVRETWILSQFTYGQSEENKKKLSVKSGRHDISLSSLTMYGQSEEKKIICKVRETWILSLFTYGQSEGNKKTRGSQEPV